MSDIKKYTIEAHGDADVLYQDRNSGMHGLNLVTLTDKSFNCDFEQLEDLLNKGCKYDKLTQQVAELRAMVAKSIDRLNDCIAQDDAQAYKEAEKFIDIASKALKESE